jgi:hypothetical protein
VVAAAVIGCGDITTPGGTVATADLLILPVQSTAPAPPTISFYVRNGAATARSITHPDQFNTPFVRLEFPSGCLASLNDQPLGPDDSVQVTVRPRSGAYGLDLSPSGLEFVSGREPTVTFSYGVYADLAAADNEPSFADRATFEAALEVWREATVDQWQIAVGSGSPGLDQASARMVRPATLVLAARR